MSATFVSIFSDDELAPELSVTCEDIDVESGEISLESELEA